MLYLILLSILKFLVQKVVPWSELDVMDTVLCLLCTTIRVIALSEQLLFQSNCSCNCSSRAIALSGTVYSAFSYLKKQIALSGTLIQLSVIS